MTGPELPPSDAVTAPWWDGTRQGRLLLQRCGSCGAAQFYPRSLCSSCGEAGTLSWIDASGAGVVDTWTVVYRAPAAGLDVPYVLARVRLAEGPVLLTHVTGVPLDEPLGGLAVRLAWRPLSDGRQLPVFAPARHIERNGR